MNDGYLEEKKAKSIIVEIGRRMFAKGFVAANDGNISVKVADNAVWTTPTMVSKGFMTEDMLVKVDLNGDRLEGELNPSSELKMHLRVYRENRTIKAVTHAHPPFATSFAIAAMPLDQPILPEAIVNLGGTVPVAPYATPGTEEVPDSVAPFCRNYNAVLLQNHGVLTWGKDPMEAYYRMESLEHYAKVSLITRFVMEKQSLLSSENIAKLL